MDGLGEHTIEITPGENWVRIQTLDYPPRCVHLWHRVGMFLVLKVDGHKYWSNSLQGSNYAPAEFQVWRIIETKRYDNGGKEDIRGERVLDFPIFGGGA